MKKNITKIVEHDISWFVADKKVKKLDEPSVDHIKESIEQGFTSGQLCICYGKNKNKETNGWWSIIDWKNIAVELYNIVQVIHNGGISDNKTVANALAAVDENWN